MSASMTTTFLRVRRVATICNPTSEGGVLKSHAERGPETLAPAAGGWARVRASTLECRDAFWPWPAICKPVGRSPRSRNVNTDSTHGGRCRVQAEFRSVFPAPSSSVYSSDGDGRQGRERESRDMSRVSCPASSLRASPSNLSHSPDATRESARL